MLDKERCDLAKKLLEDFLARNREIKGDAFVCSHAEWEKRGERYGRNSYATLAVDSSPLYNILNGYSSSRGAADVCADLDTILGNNGFYLEPAMAWAFCCYNL